jgi:hypothetical protein
MALTCYPVPGKEKSKLICSAFQTGAPKHATGAVFFGTEGVMDAYQRAKAGTWWYIDNAYTDPQRGQYFRVTKNALQVDPRGKTSTGERLKRLGLVIKDWRDRESGPVLVIPQSDNFMKSTLGKVGDWTADTVTKLKAFGVGDRIKVRPWLRDKKQAYTELRQDLDGAALVVTWSSASAITALLEGIPAISQSGSANALTGDLTMQNVKFPKRPSLVDRAQFAAVLADNQFTLDEFRDGTAWRWLERTQP